MQVKPARRGRAKDKGVSSMRRTTLALIAPVLAGICFTTPVAAETMDALAITEAAATLAPNRYLWAEDATVAPQGDEVSVLISIPDQRAYVFRGQTLIAASSVSTGKDGNETPVGSFTILQKKEKHFSNLYDSAPMPYMQRLTWDGVAMHAGANPGFPASHGCIRLPTAFAKKLFAITQMGATVEVTDTAYIAGAAPMASDDPITETRQIAAREDAAAVRHANRSMEREVAEALAAR
jgi:hypothetical protein